MSTHKNGAGERQLIVEEPLTARSHSGPQIIAENDGDVIVFLAGAATPLSLIYITSL